MRFKSFSLRQLAIVFKWLSHMPREQLKAALSKEKSFDQRKGLGGDEKGRMFKGPNVGVVVMLVGDMVIGNREPTGGR